MQGGFNRKPKDIKEAIAAMYPMVTQPSLSDEEWLKCAHEGYKAAEARGFAAVNACPYGPATPDGNNLKGLAWYRGFWFYEYTIRSWQKCCTL